MNSPHPQPNEAETQLYEYIERLFNLRISSSGAMIEVGFHGSVETMNVEYEVFSNLTKSIEALITAKTEEAVRQFAERVKDRIGGALGDAEVQDLKLHSDVAYLRGLIDDQLAKERHASR